MAQLLATKGERVVVVALKEEEAIRMAGMVVDNFKAVMMPLAGGFPLTVSHETFMKGVYGGEFKDVDRVILSLDGMPDPVCLLLMGYVAALLAANPKLNTSRVGIPTGRELFPKKKIATGPLGVVPFREEDPESWFAFIFGQRVPPVPVVDELVH